MRVSADHYNKMKAVFDGIVSKAVSEDSECIGTLWRAAQARAKKDPVIWFASFFIWRCIDALEVCNAYKYYTDYHLYTAMKKIMKENRSVAAILFPSQHECNLDKELFIHCVTGKKFYGKIQSNKTVLVRKNALPNSDAVIIENYKRGYRFMRIIELETFCPGYYYFTMI